MVDKCAIFYWLFEDDTSLTVSMAAKMPQSVGTLRTRLVDITQHQRSDRERLHMGQQA